MQVFRVLLALLVTGFCSILTAEVYQWTDEKGRVQYSDTKPPDGTAYRARTEYDLPYVHNSEPVKPQRSYRPSQSSVRAPQAKLIERTRIGRNKDDSYPCKGYLESLERIQDQMRKGYSVRQSNYYHQEKRDISERYYNECR